LSENGVLFGSTILGKDVEHTWLRWYLMKVYNKKGIFDNFSDSRKVFEDGLKGSFEDVECRIVGVSLLFEARRPKQGNNAGRRQQVA
jgi:hypothetical protein